MIIKPHLPFPFCTCTRTAVLDLLVASSRSRGSVTPFALAFLLF